jgi:hypothetical protein
MPWKGGVHVARSRIATRHVRRFKRLASGIFRRQADAFWEVSAGAGTTDDLVRAVDAAALQLHPAWRDWTKKCYVLVGADYAEDALPPRQQQKRASSIGDEDWWQLWLRLTVQYAQTQSASRIQDVDEATRQAIRRVIRDGVGAGEGIPQIRDRIDGVLRSSFTTVRAERIARTEVPTAARAGAWQAPIAFGIDGDLVKSWQDSGDVLVRHSHAEATVENQAIGYLDAFRVRSPSSGAVQLLNFPGDTSLGADASNVINCRCDSFTDLAR